MERSNRWTYWFTVVGWGKVAGGILLMLGAALVAGVVYFGFWWSVRLDVQNGYSLIGVGPLALILAAPCLIFGWMLVLRDPHEDRPLPAQADS